MDNEVKLNIDVAAKYISDALKLRYSELMTSIVDESYEEFYNNLPAGGIGVTLCILTFKDGQKSFGTSSEQLRGRLEVAESRKTVAKIRAVENLTHECF